METQRAYSFNISPKFARETFRMPEDSCYLFRSKTFSIRDTGSGLETRLDGHWPITHECTEACPKPKTWEELHLPKAKTFAHWSQLHDALNVYFLGRQHLDVRLIPNKKHPTHFTRWLLSQDDDAYWKIVKDTKADLEWPKELPFSLQLYYLPYGDASEALADAYRDYCTDFPMALS